MPSAAFDHLQAFLRDRMRMSHIYQPVMIKTLLAHGGTATRREIAAAFLTHDESQLEYYERITAQMPGRVLHRHGLVERTADGYALSADCADLSAEERDALIRLCDERVEAYKAQRGQAIWEHRAIGVGQIPGKLRYDTLKRAGFRCELCGVPADERALDVDHIRPRKHGGPDTAENFQALCWRCNADKGAGDDTDFRKVRELLDHREVGCPFCELPPERITAENTVAVAFRDHYPVTPGHTLIVPRRHVSDYFALFRSERLAIDRLVGEQRDALMQDDGSIAGFNMGVNSGQAAGQTVLHCHVHLIPRRPGDGGPPGGVRHVIPGRGNYTTPGA